MYVKTVLPHNDKANIMLLGEAPGYNEDVTGKPFQGKSGFMLDKLISSAGFSRHDCIIANVARVKPPANNIAHYFVDSKKTIPKPILAKWIEELRQEILLYKPNIIICLGATALWAITGSHGIAANRGFLLNSQLVPGQKVLATYHPAAVLRDWGLHFTVTLDLRKAYKNSFDRKIPEDKRNLILNPSVTTYLEYLDFLLHEHREFIAVDIEVRNPGSHFEIMGIADTPDHAVSFNLLNANKPKFSLEVEEKILFKLGQVLRKKSLIMHNGIYDKGVLWYNNAILSNLKFDTMVAAHVLWPESKRSLSYLTSIFLNTPEWKSLSMTAPEYYNANDAANTYGIFNSLLTELDRNNLFEIFDAEMAQIDLALFLQLNGAYVDKEKREEVKKELQPKLKKLQDYINEQAGKPVNINSPKQLHQLLYSDMALPPQYKRRKSVREKRKVTTDKEALKNLMVKYPKNKVIKAIKESKEIYKLLNSFIDVELSPKSTVHTSYNITGATMARQTKAGVFDDEGNYKSFGRWSSSKSIILTYGSGNLQNIPYQARKMYTAPKDYEYVQADYKQAEAVVMAYLINDIPLIKMFEASYGLKPSECKEKGYDIHKMTACQMFDTDFKSVTKEQRVIGKRIRHAVNYDAGPGVVAASLGCTMKEAKVLLDIYYNKNPQLLVYRQNIQNELAQTRTLTNLFGRPHRFFERWGHTLFKSAYSYKPQSTVGELLNRSYVDFYNSCPDSVIPSFQLHDAIYVLSPIARRERTIAELRKAMTRELTYKNYTFKIDVDFAAGPSWGETEELDV